MVSSLVPPIPRRTSTGGLPTTESTTIPPPSETTINGSTRFPGDYRALYNRGLAQAGLHHYSQAIADYTQSIELTPDIQPVHRAQVYADRGLIHLQLERYDEAVSDFSQAIGYDDAAIEAYCNRAYALHGLHNDTAALKDLHRVLALDPTHAKTYFNLGILRYHIGQREAAIASFEQAAYHFFSQNDDSGYAKAMTILNQLQLSTALG